MNVEVRPSDASYAEQSRTAPLSLPPDKSIFHRLLIIGALTRSKLTIPITLIEDIPVDVYATILALQSLGVPIELSRSMIELEGVGMEGFHAPTHQINCSNSGTTARLFMGLLAGQSFSSRLTGDESLSKRPMKRLAEILNSGLGAKIETSEKGTLPVLIEGRELHGATVDLPVASAQMKSAVLLAGLYSKDVVRIREPLQSRDHSELMLMSFGADIEIEADHAIRITANGVVPLQNITYNIPGDISSAAFLIGAAILGRRNITLKNVGLNPTRIRFLEILKGSGLEVEISQVKEEWNEKKGTVEIFGAESHLSKPLAISAADIPLIIDEIPILAVLASFCPGQTEISRAKELRAKESDRLSALATNLRSFGAIVEEKEDGLTIFGDDTFIPHGGSIEHFGDHRIAMAFVIMALRARERVTISDASVVSISYPNFFRDLSLVVGKNRIHIA
ncbi:MAG: 3-phosphoshikimate 1-carboxyvinyltransferase [Bacteroidota bacterium]|nr:3-phosphoshikimate 1-carboxyvinyltransferase [Bacteroidota bacterium]MDP4229319.1 3-phosphoshikimate 1-carboxyvinyltransferase [Bacteroidota bacterium]MDP4237125.1 3-phosphoshikimate 1-carboxyvinyltransferase [Bacteroidota bacterium]